MKCLYLLEFFDFIKIKIGILIIVYISSAVMFNLVQTSFINKKPCSCHKLHCNGNHRSKKCLIRSTTFKPFITNLLFLVGFWTQEALFVKMNYRAMKSIKCFFLCHISPYFAMVIKGLQIWRTSNRFCIKCQIMHVKRDIVLVKIMGGSYYDTMCMVQIAVDKVYLEHII